MTELTGYRPDREPWCIVKLGVLMPNNQSATIWFGPEDVDLDMLKVLASYTADIITDVDNVKPDLNFSNAIYDLSGRRIEKITQPGIYIKGGEKILVK